MKQAKHRIATLIALALIVFTMAVLWKTVPGENMTANAVLMMHGFEKDVVGSRISIITGSLISDQTRFGAHNSLESCETNCKKVNQYETYTIAREKCINIKLRECWNSKSFNCERILVRDSTGAKFVFVNFQSGAYEWDLTDPNYAKALECINKVEAHRKQCKEKEYTECSGHDSTISEIKNNCEKVCRETYGGVASTIVETQEAYKKTKSKLTTAISSLEGEINSAENSIHGCRDGTGGYVSTCRLNEANLKAEESRIAEMKNRLNTLRTDLTSLDDPAQRDRIIQAYAGQDSEAVAGGGTTQQRRVTSTSTRRVAGSTDADRTAQQAAADAEAERIKAEKLEKAKREAAKRNVGCYVQADEECTFELVPEYGPSLFMDEGAYASENTIYDLGSDRIPCTGAQIAAGKCQGIKPDFTNLPANTKIKIKRDFYRQHVTSDPTTRGFMNTVPVPESAYSNRAGTYTYDPSSGADEITEQIGVVGRWDSFTVKRKYDANTGIITYTDIDVDNPDARIEVRPDKTIWYCASPCVECDASKIVQDPNGGGFYYETPDGKKLPLGSESPVDVRENYENRVRGYNEERWKALEIYDECNADSEQYKCLSAAQRENVNKAFTKLKGIITGQIEAMMGTLVNHWLEELGIGVQTGPQTFCGDEPYRKQKSTTRVGPFNIPSYSYSSTMMEEIMGDEARPWTIIIDGAKDEITPTLYRYAFNLKLIARIDFDWVAYFHNSCTDDDSLDFWYEQGRMKPDKVFIKHYAGDTIFNCEHNETSPCRFNEICFEAQGHNLQIVKCFGMEGGMGFVSPGQTGTTMC